MRRPAVAAGLALLVWCSCAVSHAADRPLAVKASVDRQSITIGDRILYRVTVALRKGDEVRFPTFADKKLGPFEITASGVTTGRGWFGGKTATGWYEIATFTVGKTAVPQVTVSFKRSGDNEWLSQSTTPVPVTVTSVLPRGEEIGDIRDIKGPLAYFEVNWAAILGGAAAFLAATALFVYLRRRAMRRPVKLPHETALEELEAVKAFLARGGDIKEAFVRISDCVRFYIERSFDVKAPEMTTEEFLHSMKASSSMTMEQKDLLKGFSHECDLVKFARHLPSAAEIERVFTAARVFVEETRHKDVKAP